MRRQRDAKRAPATPKPSQPGDKAADDKAAEVVEKAVERHLPLPDMEKGRPKDTGRMGA